MISQRLNHILGLSGAALLLATSITAGAADTASTTTIPVSMTVTANADVSKRMPEITRNDIIVEQGKEKLEVTGWVPARGNYAGLELFILIDEAAGPSLSLQYDELRSFINDQPQSTSIGVGYMKNGVVQIAQELTTSRLLATQALRLPVGDPGIQSSPYLSLIDLMKRWPVDTNRREVLMFTDGAGRERYHGGWHRGFHNDVDADTATAVAQRTGTNVFTIYTPGRTKMVRSRWAVLNGQENMTRLSEATGGASFYFGVHGPVSIRPYLGQLETMLNNQYLLSFSAKSGKKAGLQTIKLSTEVAGVELAAHDAVWIGSEK